METNERERWFLGTRMSLKVTAEDSEGAMSVIEQIAPQGFSPPLHVHEAEDTVMQVLEGQLTVRLGDVSRVLGAGEWAFLPKGVPHTFRVDSERARLLEITTPGGFEAFVRANSEPAGATTLPEGPPSIDPAALARSAAAHRAPLVGPPLAP